MKRGDSHNEGRKKIYTYVDYLTWPREERWEIIDSWKCIPMRINLS